MDSIEKSIYNWVFRGSGVVELSERLKEMPKEKDANDRFKQLNKMVEENLSKMGANRRSVPMVLRGFNIFLFALSILIVIRHINYNGFEIYNYNYNLDVKVTIGIIIVILLFSIQLLPLILGLISVILNVIIMVRHKINKTIQRVTGQRVVSTTVSLMVLFGIIMLLTALITPGSYSLF